jgi:hypothetical protein
VVGGGGGGGVVGGGLYYGHDENLPEVDGGSSVRFWKVRCDGGARGWWGVIYRLGSDR